MFENRTNDSYVKLAQLSGQSINVSVIDFGFRVEQAMTKPVGILPLINFLVVLLNPPRWISKGKFVFEGEKVLLTCIINIKRKDAARTVFFSFKTKKPSGSANIDHRFSCNGNTTDVIVKPVAQVPMSAHFTKQRQIHRVIEETIFQTIDVALRCKSDWIFLVVTHDLVSFLVSAPSLCCL